MRCNNDYKKNRILIECPICAGAECEHCRGGHIHLDQCPTIYMGPEMARCVNAIGYAERGFLPVAGGSLDQSQLFLNVFTAMQSEVNRIQQDDAKAAQSKNKRRR